MSDIHFTTGGDDDLDALALCGVMLFPIDEDKGPEHTDHAPSATCSACRTLLDDAGGDLTPDEDQDDDDDDDAPLDAMDELIAEELENDE